MMAGWGHDWKGSNLELKTIDNTIKENSKGQMYIMMASIVENDNTTWLSMADKDEHVRVLEADSEE